MTAAERRVWDDTVARARVEGRYTVLNPVLPARLPLRQQFGKRNHDRPGFNGRRAVLAPGGPGAHA